jgi:hypothetical protein
MASGFPAVWPVHDVWRHRHAGRHNAVFKAVASGQVKHQVLVFGLVFVSRDWRSSWVWCRFTCGFPTSIKVRSDSVTLMVAGAPKLAAFAIVIRLLVEGFLPLAFDWQQMLGVLAVASLPGESGRHRTDQPEAHAGVLDHFPDGFCAAGSHVGRGQWQCVVGSQCLQLGHVLHRDLCADDAGQLSASSCCWRAKVSRARKSPISPV